jgi:hypothetical protein
MKGLTALVLTCLVTSTEAADLSPYELRGYADMRAVVSDSSLRSFAQGGLGLLRYDERHDGLRAGRIAFDASGPLTDALRAQLTALIADGEQNPVDLTEAFIEWRPYPTSQWRWRSKLGAFYPPISLENRGVAWQTPYSLSSSAINTWIGEEIRAIGVEVTATNTGAAAQRPYDVGIVGGIYGWNDPMGVLLFQRGWAIHDRESTLFGAVQRPFSRAPYNHRIESFHEIDNRPGYYAGVELKWRNQHVLRALHYDNRADPAQVNRSDTAWLNHLEAIGARLELPANFTLITQRMWGDTAIGESADGRGSRIADLRSYFVLVSHLHGRHRVTLRYDSMYISSVRGREIFNSRQDAHAWTAAYLLNWNDQWMTGVEALRIKGSLEQRRRIGLPPAATEQQLQIALRYSF